MIQLFAPAHAGAPARRARGVHSAEGRRPRRACDHSQRWRDTRQGADETRWKVTRGSSRTATDASRTSTYGSSIASVSPARRAERSPRSSGRAKERHTSLRRGSATIARAASSAPRSFQRIVSRRTAHRDERSRRPRLKPRKASSVRRKLPGAARASWLRPRRGSSSERGSSRRNARGPRAQRGPRCVDR